MSIKTLCTPSRFLVAPGLPPQVIPDVTDTQIDLPTLHFDALDEFDLVANTFTPRRAGYYLLNAHMQFVAGGAAFPAVISISNIGVAVAMDVEEWIDAGKFVTIHGSVIVYCTPNDNWGFTVWQNTGGNKNINPTNNITFFCGHRLS
jgi:hypothetical protein